VLSVGIKIRSVIRHFVQVSSFVANTTLKLLNIYAFSM